MIKNLALSLSLTFVLLFSLCTIIAKAQSIPNKIAGHDVQPYSFSKPRVYWWWFASEIKPEDVKTQLLWLKENNIGGVMIFFLYPQNKIKKDTVHYAPRYTFLGKEFTDICTYTKHECDSLGISCNFLCGTGWPFGGSFVSKEDATLSWTNNGIEPMQTFNITWEWPKKGYVIDHLSRKALDHYFDKVSKAFIPALKGNKTYLECDSWEIAEFEPIWTNGFAEMFKKEYGYDIIPYVSKFTPVDKKKDSLLYNIQPYISKLYDYSDKAAYTEIIPPNSGQRLMRDVRYDYYSLVSNLVTNNFYRHFTKLCNSIGSGSIVECNGTPADIIDCYSSIDIPQTEAMLYEPNYTKIVASAAALGGKNIVPSESFTCAYGFRDKFGYKEQVADMKLVADALFANGANLVYWHGFPLNPVGSDSVKYYATLYVSPKSKLMNGFKDFNAYMAKVCNLMQLGKSYADIAVYLPMEDRWAEGMYSKDFLDKLRPEERWWHFSQYQMRYEYFPEELKGYPMLWINSSFLQNAKYENGLLITGDQTFKMLVLDVNLLPYETLLSVVELAKKGLPVYLKRDPMEPGTIKHNDYSSLLAELKALKNVSSDYKKIFTLKPLIEGIKLPDFWTRKDNDYIYVFIANPKTRELKYPVQYGQSLQDKNIPVKFTLNYAGNSTEHYFVFKPYQSLMLRIDKHGNFTFLDIKYTPPTPQTKAD